MLFIERQQTPQYEYIPNIFYIIYCKFYYDWHCSQDGLM